MRHRAIEALKRELGGGRPWRETHLDGEAFAFGDCIEALRSSSLFDEGVIVHLRRVEKLSDEQAGALAPHLEHGLPADRALILEGERLDRRKALYKTVKERGEIHHHPSPGRRDLPPMVRDLLSEKGIELDSSAFRYLLESVEGDLSRIAREAEKLAIFAGEGRRLSERDLRGLLFHDRGGNVFACLDALLERRRDAPERLREVLAGGEEPSKAFYLLAAQVRGLLRVQSLADEGLSNDEIARQTGEFKWLVGKRRRVAESLERGDLIALIHRLHEEDVRIKRGEREPEEALWAIALDWVFIEGPKSQVQGPRSTTGR